MAELLAIRVEGMEDFLGELKRVDPEFKRTLAKTHREVAKIVRDDARQAAPSRHRSAITSRADPKSAKVTVKPGRRGDSLAVFLGMKGRSGWYARRQFRSSRGRQHRPWVGNQWDPGATGGVPYLIGPAINRSVDDVVDEYGEVLGRIFAAAFPD